MYVIGITGGAGCGKSSVVRHLTEQYGAVLISTDELGRALLKPEGAAYRAVISLFGREVLLPDGQLDRARIAERIFQNEYERLALDGVIHPAVKKETLRLLKETEEAPLGKDAIVLIESALLIEAQYGAICNEMWYIYASEDTRYRRLRGIRGWTDKRIRGVFERQLSEEAFRAGTGLSFDNDGDLASCLNRVDERMREILRMSAR